MYAVNLTDWQKFSDDFSLRVLLAPVIKNRTIVDCEPGKFDGPSIQLDCDEERAAAIVDLVRKRYLKPILRCYYSKTGKGGWERL